MAIIIHIQEAKSTQITELIHASTEKAITAYAKNAASNWGELFNTRFRFFPNSTIVRRAVFEFNRERLIILHEFTTEKGTRYKAAWLEQG